MSQVDLPGLIRNVPDFPQPGIQFKDITTLLSDGPAFQQVIGSLTERYARQGLDAIIGVESRGFIFGAPLAYTLGVGLVLVRKPGKLPAATYQASYELEYGVNTLEIHKDALQPGARVVIVDDLLVERVGGVVAELAFLIELAFLDGRAKLTNYPVFSLITY